METGQINSNAALAKMTERYEALVRDFGLLGQIEALEGERLSTADACARLVALIALEGIAEYCSIMLLDREGSYLELRAVATRYSDQGFYLDSEVWKGKRFALSEGIAGQVAATGIHVRINDTLADPHFLRLPDSPVNIRSLMCFPLVDQREILGVINLSQGSPDFFSMERERAMVLVASHMGRILGRALHAAPQHEAAGPGLLLLLDREGRVRRISDNCTTLTGMEAAAWVEGGHRWSDYVAARDRADYGGYREALEQGLPNEGHSYAFVRPDGLERQVNEIAIPLAAEGSNGGWIVSIRAESATMSKGQWPSNQAASRMLHAQHIHTMGQLASGIVHDLNSLLTGIVGNLDLALVSNSEDESADLIARARTASIRGADIVSKMINFGRAGTGAREQAPLNPAGVLEEAAGILRSSLDPKIVMEVAIPATVSSVCADGGQLCQVLLNLGINARDALEQRGPESAVSDWKLKMGLENIHLDEASAGPWGQLLAGDFVRIYVSDNGTGMSPDVLARIYEPFFTTRAQGKGTGLGLSTVYRIVRHHRGWIDVHSAPRKGTTFNIYLPACPVESTEPGSTSDVPDPDGPECVLLVDDEALVRNLGAAILKRLGYHAITAKDGKDGLEKFEEHRDRIGVVILDLQMPGMGGEAVLQQIREIDPGMPVVYSTGMAFFESDGLPEHLRPTGMLKKPYLIATMSEIVRDAISRRR